MHDTLTLYKLIVLYMLSRVDFPLTRAQIGDFMLNKEYTLFPTFQKVIGELTEAGFITAQSVRNRTLLSITGEGRETLNFFSNQLLDDIKTDIDHFLKENELKLRNEISVLADFYKSTSGEYEAHLTAKEKDVTLLEIKLSVPSAETAAAICENWQHKNQEIYQYLISRLF